MIVRYDRPSHSHVPSGLIQPSSSVRSDNIDQYSDYFEDFSEIYDSSVSPLALGREAETLLLRYLGDLYRVNAKSSGAGSLWGGGDVRRHTQIFLF